jgi:hypothetical protein
VIGRAISRDALREADRDAMYALLARHFEGVERAQFAKDLDEKSWVILLDAPDGRLAGFSTLLAYDTEHAGERLAVICSGDTIVDREHWGSSALPRAWIETVLALPRSASASRLVWLLIVSGFRTYRFLPVFFQSFYPCHRAPAPPGTQDLIRALASQRFGRRYDPHAGVVRFAHPQRLRPELARIPDGRRASPHVSFFERANPGHAAGDELVCFTELAPGNLTRAGLRMLRSTR